jgi:hypothetical protein
MKGKLKQNDEKRNKLSRRHKLFRRGYLQIARSHYRDLISFNNVVPVNANPGMKNKVKMKRKENSNLASSRTSFI